jgi:hypothetical protein
MDSHSDDRKALDSLIDKINSLLQGEDLVVHSLQFSSADFPSVNVQAWRTVSLDIEAYRTAVSSFLAFRKETGEYSRSLLERDFDDRPYWYDDLGEESPDDLMNGERAVQYTFHREVASRLVRKGNDTASVDRLWGDWKGSLELQFKGGATMWISQPYLSTDQTTLVSSIFLVLSKKITEEILKHKIAKLCKDFMVTFIVHLYQRKLNTELQLIDEQLLRAIDNVTDVIFTEASVRKRYAQFMHAIHSRVPILIEGELGTGKLSIARSIYNIRQDVKGNALSVYVVMNLGLAPDDAKQFLDELKDKITQAHRENSLPEGQSAQPTVVFDDVHLASMKVQRIIKEILDYSLGLFGHSPAAGMERIDKAIFITVKGRAGDLPTNRFLEELWFRISLFTFTAPPLRHRKEELSYIIDVMHPMIKTAYDLRKIRPLSASAIERLKQLDFPGNYRELFNILLTAQFTTPEEYAEIGEQHLGI